MSMKKDLEIVYTLDKKLKLYMKCIQRLKCYLFARQQNYNEGKKFVSVHDFQLKFVYISYW